MLSAFNPSRHEPMWCFSTNSRTSALSRVAGRTRESAEGEAPSPTAGIALQLAKGDCFRSDSAGGDHDPHLGGLADGGPARWVSEAREAYRRTVNRQLDGERLRASGSRGDRT